MRRHRKGIAISVVGFVLLPLLVIGLFLWLFTHALDDIERFPLEIGTDRPGIENYGAINLLVMGGDAGTARGGNGSSIIQDAASGVWPVGKYRSDVMMLVHINPERNQVWVVSIPRDSYVPVYDGDGVNHGKQKINAALSLYGPEGAVVTYEKLTNVRINHVVLLDWDGFAAVTDALGGVDISIDGMAPQHMNGEQALWYVRERKTLPRGDFDRIARQHNYLRALMLSIMGQNPVTSPLRALDVVRTLAANTAVEDGFSTSEVRDLGLSLRKIRPADVTFLTTPWTTTTTLPVAGSVVILDPKIDRGLFKALREGTIGTWVSRNTGWTTGPVVP